MTTPTPVHEAAQRAAKRIKSEFSIGSQSNGWVGVDTYELTELISAEFAPIVERAELADELAKALEGDACLIHEKNLSGEHAVDNFDVCPVPRCINRRKLIAAHKAAQKASTP